MRNSGVPTSVVHVDTYDAAVNFLERKGDFTARQGADPCLVIIETSSPDEQAQRFLGKMRKTLKKPLPTVLLCEDCPQDQVRTLYDAGLNSLLIMPADFDAYGEWLFETIRYWVHLNCAKILMA